MHSQRFNLFAVLISNFEFLYTIVGHEWVAPSLLIPCQTTEKNFDIPKMASNFLDHLHTPNKEGQGIVLAIFVIFGHILDIITFFTLSELRAYISWLWGYYLYKLQSECEYIIPYIFKSYFFSKKLHFLDFGHFQAILGVWAIFTIPEKYHRKFFSYATYRFLMIEIWFVWILVEIMAIFWPQGHISWILGHFWAILHLTHCLYPTYFF